MCIKRILDARYFILLYIAALVQFDNAREPIANIKCHNPLNFFIRNDANINLYWCKRRKFYYKTLTRYLHSMGYTVIIGSTTLLVWRLVMIYFLYCSKTYLYFTGNYRDIQIDHRTLRDSNRHFSTGVVGWP